MNNENLKQDINHRALYDASARAADAKNRSPFLSTPQAAHYVSLSRRTLEKMRSSGEGTEYRKHGRYVMSISAPGFSGNITLRVCDGEGPCLLPTFQSSSCS